MPAWWYHQWNWTRQRGPSNTGRSWLSFSNRLVHYIIVLSWLQGTDQSRAARIWTVKTKKTSQRTPPQECLGNSLRWHLLLRKWGHRSITRRTLKGTTTQGNACMMLSPMELNSTKGTKQYWPLMAFFFQWLSLFTTLLYFHDCKEQVNHVLQGFELVWICNNCHFLCNVSNKIKD